MSKSLKKNTIFNAIKSILSVMYPLVTFPYISRVLLTENVGKINFSNSIVSYFSLIASLGITTYGIRECSKFRDDKDKLQNIANEILSINVVSTVVAYIALAITLIYSDTLYNYRELILIQSLTILFTTFGADWINTAMEDFKYITIRTIIVQIISLLLMFLFIHSPKDYIKYAIISVIATSGANLVNIFYRKKYFKTRFVFKADMMKRHLPSILLLFSMVISQTIYTSSDITILGFYRGDYQVGLYSTSVKIYNVLNYLIASIAWVVMPQISLAFLNKQYDKICKLSKFALNFIIVLGIPCLVGLNCVAKEIIVLLAGKSYIGAATSLRILTLALLFSFIGGWISNMFLIPDGKENICLKASIISAVINLILNFIFIPKFGINAAAFTTVMAEFIGVFILISKIDKKIKINGIKKMLTAPIIGGITIIFVCILIKYLVKNPYKIALLSISFSIIVYMLVLIILKNEFTLNFIRPVIKRLKRS